MKSPRGGSPPAPPTVVVAYSYSRECARFVDLGSRSPVSSVPVLRHHVRHAPTQEACRMNSLDCCILARVRVASLRVIPMVIPSMFHVGNLQRETRERAEHSRDERSWFMPRDAPGTRRSQPVCGFDLYAPSLSVHEASGVAHRPLNGRRHSPVFVHLSVHRGIYLPCPRPNPGGASPRWDPPVSSSLGPRAPPIRVQPQEHMPQLRGALNPSLSPAARAHAAARSARSGCPPACRLRRRRASG